MTWNPNQSFPQTQRSEQTQNQIHNNSEFEIGYRTNSLQHALNVTRNDWDNTHRKRGTNLESIGRVIPTRRRNLETENQIDQETYTNLYTGAERQINPDPNNWLRHENEQNSHSNSDISNLRQSRNLSPIRRRNSSSIAGEHIRELFDLDFIQNNPPIFTLELDCQPSENDLKKISDQLKKLTRAQVKSKLIIKTVCTTCLNYHNINDEDEQTGSLL
jgi:hypothetical protein